MRGGGGDGRRGVGVVERVGPGGEGGGGQGGLTSNYLLKNTKIRLKHRERF